MNTNGFVNICGDLLRYDVLVALVDTKELRNIFKPNEEPSKDFFMNAEQYRAALIDKLGDLAFYMQLMQNRYKISKQEILQNSASKLEGMYVALNDKYDEHNEPDN